jgi:hypothetical protein
MDHIEIPEPPVPYTFNPNAETIAAMKKADAITRNPNVKSYTDIAEMFKDILSSPDEDDDEYCKYLYKEFVRDTDPTKNDAEPIESIVKELGIPPDKQE